MGITCKQIGVLGKMLKKVENEQNKENQMRKRFSAKKDKTAGAGK